MIEKEDLEKQLENNIIKKYDNLDFKKVKDDINSIVNSFSMAMDTSRKYFQKY